MFACLFTWLHATVRKQAVKYTLARLLRETELPFVHFLSWPCTAWIMHKSSSLSTAESRLRQKILVCLPVSLCAASLEENRIL